MNLTRRESWLLESEIGAFPDPVCQDVLHTNLIRLSWFPVSGVVVADAGPEDVAPSVLGRDLINRLAVVQPRPTIIEIAVITRPHVRGVPVDVQCRGFLRIRIPAFDDCATAIDVLDLR